MSEAMLAPDFDMEAHIRARLLDIMHRELRREDARMVYGTRAVKQRASKHTRPRREKRR